MTEHHSDNFTNMLETCLLSPALDHHPSWSLGITRLVGGHHVPLVRVGELDPFVQDAGDQIQLSAPIRFEGVTLGRVYALVGDLVSPEDQSTLQSLSELVAPLLASPADSLATRSLAVCQKLQSRFSSFDWVGVYRLEEAGSLVLTCQLGAPTPHVRLDVSTGICGAAVREGMTLNVPDVSADPRFIACSTKTRSELVVPVRDTSGHIVAEIDVDSDSSAAFGAEEIKAVEEAARALGLTWA
jgi:GAF domain-containing protein